MDEDLPAVVMLTEEESQQLFDEACRREAGVSGEEFLRRYDAGEYTDEQLDPDLIGLVMLIPFGRAG